MTGTAPLLTPVQILEAFAAGEISRDEVMDLLHLSSYSLLLNALADRGIAPTATAARPRIGSGAGDAGGAGGGSDPLQAFARGLLSQREAIRAGRVRNYAGFLAALGAAGLAPPRALEREIEAEAALFLRLQNGGMGRATLLVAEEAPLWSLRAAGRLDLLPGLGMQILVLDGVLDAVSGDAAIGAFIEAHSPPFAVEQTYAGDIAHRRRRAGEPSKSNAADVALADFLTAGGGIDRYLRSGDPFLVLCDRIRGLRLFGAPPNLHLLSTAGLLGGLEKAGVIPSADKVLRAMHRPAGR